MIEELDDILNDLLNHLGIYGGCDDKCTKENLCRCHAESYWRERILTAVKVKLKLNSMKEFKTFYFMESIYKDNIDNKVTELLNSRWNLVNVQKLIREKDSEYVEYCVYCWKEIL
jgi:hypothetical protein